MYCWSAAYGLCVTIAAAIASTHSNTVFVCHRVGKGVTLTHLIRVINTLLIRVRILVSDGGSQCFSHYPLPELPQQTDSDSQFSVSLTRDWVIVYLER